MVRPLFALLLAILVFFSGFGSIYSNKVLTDGGEESSGDCGTILPTVQMSEKLLDKLDDTVRSISPNLRETVELFVSDQLEKIKYITESKFDVLNKKMGSMFLQVTNDTDSKLAVIEDKISEYTSDIDCKIAGLESNITHALNVSNAHSKCESSQQEECCTTAVVTYREFTKYTEMSDRGRHTVVNMTCAGLHEYTMYFAVKGEYVRLLLSSTSPRTDLYYDIGFIDSRGGNIDMWVHTPADNDQIVHDIFPTNSIFSWRYSYYYVTISGDTLKVGRRGEPPLMTHTNTELNKLKYFSFQWWGGFGEGEALYDCTAE